MHVVNVAPSIAISGAANVNEGSVYTLTLGAVTDPGTDTVTSYVVHWGDGSDNTYGANGAKTHTYADGDANRPITVDLVDEDGTFLDRANALSVHVVNVAPSIAISGATNVNEGSAYTLTLGAVTDPGTDTVTGYVVHWGDGSDNTYGANGAKTHTYADGDANRPITVDLVDEDGTFLDRANAKSVHVDNVAPSIVISGATNVNEGSAYTLTLGAVTDPGTDTVTSYVVHWGDGNTSTYSTNGAKTHTYADGPASRSITVDLTDEDGTFLDRANAKSVTVDNVAPTVTLTGPSPVAEGSTNTYNYTTNDPGTETFSRDAQSCDGGTLSGATFNPANGTGSFDCTYADGPSSHNPSVTVSDGDGGSDDDSRAVTVNNVPPTVTAPANQSTNATVPHSFTLGSFSDPGANDNPWAVDVDWGDLSAHTPFTQATQGSLGSQSHTYATAATYTVAVKVTDKDGSFDTKTFQVTVSPNVDAVNDNATVIANSANNPIDVLANDTPSGATITAVQSPTAMGGTASACATCVSGGPGVSYTPPADYSGGDTFTYTITDGAGHFDTATVSITIQTSGTMDSTMILEDADLHNLDGSFDVLFSKSPRPYDTTYMRLKSTSPGHIHLRAEIHNNTNVNFDADHYNRASTIITVPDMPSNCGLAGVDCSNPTQQDHPGPTYGKPSWELQDNNAVRVHPDDSGGDMPVDIQYKVWSAGVDCASPAGYSSTLPPDGVVKCIKISGFAIPRGHKAKIEVKFDFRPKDTDWLASKKPDLNFRAGFNFILKKMFTYNYGTQYAQTFTAQDNVVGVGVGKRVTAIGGFAFVGTLPATGDAVRLFNTPAAAGISPSAPYGSCAVTPAASNIVDGDGFYFISKTGANQDDPGAPALPSGVQYVVQLCNGATPVAARTLRNRLGDKEFDEEDFNDAVNPWPASLTINHQNNAPSSGDTVRVMFSEQLSEASMCSTWGLDNNRDQNLSGVTVRIVNGSFPTNDSLIVSSVSGACAGTFHFGSIDLGSPNYVTTDVNFTTSSIQWNHNGQLTVTLGGAPSGITPVASSVTAIYTPDQLMTDPAGNTPMGTASDTPDSEHYHF